MTISGGRWQTHAARVMNALHGRPNPDTTLIRSWKWTLDEATESS